MAGMMIPPELPVLLRLRPVQAGLFAGGYLAPWIAFSFAAAAGHAALHGAGLLDHHMALAGHAAAAAVLALAGICQLCPFKRACLLRCRRAPQGPPTLHLLAGRRARVGGLVRRPHAGALRQRRHERAGDGGADAPARARACAAGAGAGERRRGRGALDLRRAARHRLSAPPRDRPRRAPRRARAAAASSRSTGTVIVPAHAGVGDALAVDQRAGSPRSWRPSTRKLSIITPMMPALAAAPPARRRRARPRGWRRWSLLAVAVAGVDHQPRRQRRRRAARPASSARWPRRSWGRCAPPRRMTWQSGLPRVATIAGQALLGHAEEAVRMGGRPDGVDGDLHAAVGAVLEADRHRAGRRPARGAPGSRSCARRSRPRHQVGDELRRDRVEELAAGRQPELDQVEQQPPRQPQPLVDREAAVQVRVVDQPLPADGGARLLEVDAHHDAADRRPARRPAPCSRRAYSSAGRRVVDRAGPDHDDAAGRPRRAGSRATSLAAHAATVTAAWLAERQLLEQDRRRQQRADALDCESRVFIAASFGTRAGVVEMDNQALPQPSRPETAPRRANFQPHRPPPATKVDKLRKIPPSGLEFK